MSFDEDARQDNRQDIGSTPVAIARTAAFLALMLLLWLAQFTYSYINHENAFRMIGIFYRAILWVMGFRVRVHGTPCHNQPTFFVSNHTSYLDIPVLGSVIPASFVAKAEVRDWPVIGFLCARQKTIFIERHGSRAAEQRGTLHRHLLNRESMILFPEGTSSMGLSVMPFKSTLFSLVEGDLPVDVTVQPVTIACTEIDGIPVTRAQRPLYAWFGDADFAPHLWQVFRRGHFTVDVLFHAPVKPGDFADRKALATYCQQQVARGIEQCLAGRGCTIAPMPSPVPAPQQLTGSN